MSGTSVENFVLNFLSVWEKIKFLSWYVFLAAPCTYIHRQTKTDLIICPMLWYSNGTDKNALIDPVTLTFEPQNSTTSRVSQGHSYFHLYGELRSWGVTGRRNGLRDDDDDYDSLHQVWTLWDHSFLSYAADKRMELKILPTPTTVVGVDNEKLLSSTRSAERRTLFVCRTTSVGGESARTASPPAPWSASLLPGDVTCQHWCKCWPSNQHCHTTLGPVA